MAITLHTDADAQELPEQSELVQGRDRDDFQQAIDGDVLALKTATAKAGWPAPDSKKLFHRYVVGADDKAALKTVIRRALTMHKLDGVWYKDAKTEAGHLVVKFHVTRKPVLNGGVPVTKDGATVYVADDTLNADGTPKAK